MIAPYDRRHCEPHAVLREEDRQLVLTPDAPPEPTHEPLKTLAEEAMGWRGHAVGSVAVRPGRPARILLIVHDLDLTPSWREEWVRLSLRAALLAARIRGLTDLALPLIGTVHARLSRERALALLAAAIAETGHATALRFWLEHEDDFTCQALREAVAALHRPSTQAE